MTQTARVQGAVDRELRSIRDGARGAGWLRERVLAPPSGGGTSLFRGAALVRLGFLSRKFGCKEWKMAGLHQHKTSRLSNVQSNNALCCETSAPDLK
ncbi:hypothetical protein AOLI_G00224100 [Acnodon oligacanthus]